MAKPKSSAFSDHFLLSNHSYFDSFNVLTKEKERFLLQLKRKFINNEKTSLNRNIRSAQLHLFEKELISTLGQLRLF